MIQFQPLEPEDERQRTRNYDRKRPRAHELMVGHLYGRPLLKWLRSQTARNPTASDEQTAPEGGRRVAIERSLY